MEERCISMMLTAPPRLAPMRTWHRLLQCMGVCMVACLDFYSFCVLSIVKPMLCGVSVLLYHYNSSPIVLKVPSISSDPSLAHA